MREGSRLGITIFCRGFGARFAPDRAERQVGKTREDPSTLGRREYPPQAVENRKIASVSISLRNALFPAGKGLAEKGNTLGRLTHSYVMGRTARSLN
jgi:hypothetical protein